MPHEAGPSFVDPTISLAPPQCQDHEVLPEGSTHVSRQATKYSMDKSVQIDSVTVVPSLQPDFTKILTLKEKLTDVLMLITIFLSIYKSNLRSQSRNNSFLSEVYNYLVSHHQRSSLPRSLKNINEGSRGLSTLTLATISDINLSSEIVPDLNLTSIQPICNPDLNNSITDARIRFDSREVNLPNNNDFPANIRKCGNIISAGFCKLEDKYDFGYDRAPIKLHEKSMPDNGVIKNCKFFKQGNCKLGPKCPYNQGSITHNLKKRN